MNSHEEGGPSRSYSKGGATKMTILPALMIAILAALSADRQGSGAISPGPAIRSVEDSNRQLSCPFTKPPVPAFIPPRPYPRLAGPDEFWFGNSRLWIALLTSGTLRLPRASDRSLRQKLMWWREGYDWRRNRQPPLQLTGKRLDAPAPPLEADDHANAGWTDDPDHPFIVTGINLPTPGCWKITGRLDDAELTFVVDVVE